MIFICVKNWIVKPIPCGRRSNTLENFVTKSILNSWKELIFIWQDSMGFLQEIVFTQH